MERPLKRMRISNPEIRSPRDPGSQMAEGLFTSETGIRSDDSDQIHPVPSRTINLSDFQRRGIVVENHLARPALQRRNAYQLVPRAPDATVTANVIEINVGDGTATSAATTIPAVSSGTVVSLEDLGSLTVPAANDVTSVVGSILTDSQSIITTPPPTTLPSDSTSSGSSQSPTGSLSSESSGNSTLSGSSTSESTVTVTATSTLDFAYLSGTFITTSFSGRSTGTLGDTRHSGSSTSTAGPSGIGVSSDLADSSSSTFYGAGGPFATGSTTTSSGSAASSSSSKSDNSGGPGLTPTQQTVVGGVVGGVAGLAIILLVLLAFLRWYRRRLKARGELPEQIAQRNLMGGPSHHHTMSQRSSGIPLTSAVAASLRKFRPISSHTTGTTATVSTLPSTIPDSERGFQRIAGRKIAPVLGTRGDGFGGNYGAFEKEVGLPGPSTYHRNERSLAGSSFYHDSNGFYGGRGDTPSSPTTATTVTGPQPQFSPGPSVARDFAEEDLLHPLPNQSQVSLPSSRPEGMAALRPSPARTPVTVSPAASSIRLPIQQQPAMDDAPPLPTTPAGAGLAVPMSRDSIGRSLASQDGSRVSRSSGRSRFAEQM